jgi:transcriptional regulator with GAF, ATPase, and Fis domain
MNTESRTDRQSASVQTPAAYARPADEGAPRLDTLRAVTRHMATADHLDTVLQSIVSGLVERADGLFSRLFLYLDDHECEICRERIDAGAQVASDQRSLHLLATAGPSRNPNGPRHRVPLDGPRLASEVMRTGTPLHLPDVRSDERAMRDPVISELVRERGAVGMAGYPLDFRGERLGVVGYVSRNTISKEAFDMLGIFADQAAMAIKNALLFRELDRYKERLQIENAYLAEEIRAERGFEEVVGASPALRAVIRQVKQVAPVDSTVLLTGETGTGKELVARAIHGLSPRSSRPLIKMNCGAIPHGLVESELFGHERGAFTGALQRRIGRFELADKGTLFMDEVGELPLDTQIKLLRVLQEHELERVGGTRQINVDVRLVAATNRDLDAEVGAGRFRSDLFFRLNVFPIHIPPLRERPDDIPLLVRHFLGHFQRKLGKPLHTVTPASLTELQRYPWPGNIRELQNVVERACVLARSPTVDVADALRMSGEDGAEKEEPIQTLENAERALVRRALAATNGKVHGADGAAALLGLNGNTLRSRMQKLGITKHVS